MHREGITMSILICRRHLYRMPHYLMKRIKFVELKLFGHSSAIFIQLLNETMIFSWISLFTNATIWGLVLPFNLPWRDLIKCYLAQFDIIVLLPIHTHSHSHSRCAHRETEQLNNRIRWIMLMSAYKYFQTKPSPSPHTGRMVADEKMKKKSNRFRKPIEI